jgi:ATP/maltotriose-dependent transcriptional regulator MalT
VPAWAVQRPRITKLIASGTQQCPLTVVTGPPGAGKTMALALWTAAEPRTTAWVSLDEFDSQPGIFWPSVIAALRRSGVATPEAPPAAAEDPAADHGFLFRLAAALAAHDRPVTLVADDLHLLTEPTALNGLDFLLRNVGPGPRLAAISMGTRPGPDLFVKELITEDSVLTGYLVEKVRRRVGSSLYRWRPGRAARPACSRQPGIKGAPGAGPPPDAVVVLERFHPSWGMAP